ncbi:MAG: DEAD/DEAH box helicase [Flavobacteriales bacterium]|jgi:ATP-dependent RNA helicase DeaD|nr:DEAD/DEAH box helicase [Flavobacteriales bacterium]
MNQNFIELGLEDVIVQAVDHLGFEKPSPVQEKCIPIVLSEETDLVALAQTGTGKTASFGLPLIQKIDNDNRKTQALVLAPTRELCIQIAADLNDFARFKKTNVVAVYGGASITDQAKKLKRGAQVIVATPGRLQDMINRRLVDLSHIDYLVLDEADEMLNMGFQDAIDEILETASEDRNTWLYSATMPKSVAKIASNYMNDPIEVTCGTKNQAASTVEHNYYLIDNRDRYKALRRIVDSCPSIYAIVFCRTRAETQTVSERLMADGYNTGGLHGDMSQVQRDGVMKQFKTKNISILVATDVASRGIDVDEITHVIHYQLPDDVEVYTHRSGRTGRAGKAGTSVALVGGRDKFKLVQIEKTINRRIERKMVPSGEEVMKSMVFQSMNNLINAQAHPNALKPFTEAIHELAEQMTVTEVLEKFIALNSSKILNFYKDAQDLNASGKGRDKSSNSERIFINIGEKDGFDWATLKDLLREKTSLTNEDFGGVDVKGAFSFFNVSKTKVEGVFAAFEGFSIGDRKVSLEVTKQTKSPDRRGGRDRRRGGGGNWSKDRRGSGSRDRKSSSRGRRERRR